MDPVRLRNALTHPLLTLSIQSMSVRHGAPLDTSGGSEDPQSVLAFKCSFRQITKVLKLF